MLFLRDVIGKRTACTRVYTLLRDVRSCLYFTASLQSRSHHWMIGCRSANQNAAEHLPLSRPFTTLLHCAHASPVQQSAHQLYPLFTAVRFRKRKMVGRKSEQPAEDEVVCHPLSIL